MIAPLLARVILVLFVAPMLLFIVSIAFGITAAQLGDTAGVVAASVVLTGALLGLSAWLATLAREFGDSSDGCGTSNAPVVSSDVGSVIALAHPD